MTDAPIRLANSHKRCEHICQIGLDTNSLRISVSGTSTNYSVKITQYDLPEKIASLQGLYEILQLAIEYEIDFQAWFTNQNQIEESWIFLSEDPQLEKWIKDKRASGLIFMIDYEGYSIGIQIPKLLLNIQYFRQKFKLCKKQMFNRAKKGSAGKIFNELMIRGNATDKTAPAASFPKNQMVLPAASIRENQIDQDFLVSYSNNTLTFYQLPSLKISKVPVKIPKEYTLGCITVDKLYFFKPMECFEEQQVGSCFIYEIKTQKQEMKRMYSPVSSSIPQVLVWKNKVYCLPRVSEFGGAWPSTSKLKYFVSDRSRYGVAQYMNKFIYIFGGFTYACYDWRQYCGRPREFEESEDHIYWSWEVEGETHDYRYTLSIIKVDMTNIGAQRLSIDLPEPMMSSTGITINENQILIYGGHQLNRHDPCKNVYLLNVNTNKIRKCGEIPGKGGLVLSHIVFKGKLYSLWGSGAITELSLKSGMGRVVAGGTGGWFDTYPFLWACEQVIPNLGANLQREIAEYISSAN